jgi:hypothetical protein
VFDDSTAYLPRSNISTHLTENRLTGASFLVQEQSTDGKDNTKALVLSPPVTSFQSVVLRNPYFHQQDLGFEPTRILRGVRVNLADALHYKPYLPFPCCRSNIRTRVSMPMSGVRPDT